MIFNQSITASGGASIVAGRIRGDAELAKSWTYDKLIVADEGVTIPAYTTTDTVLKSGAALTAESLDFASYSYTLLYRSLATPIYSNSTKSYAKEIYHAQSSNYRFVYTPPSEFGHDGTSAIAASKTNVFTSVGTQNYARLVYYYSSSGIWFDSVSYGAYTQLGTSPSASATSTSPFNTGTLTITAPHLKIRGNSGYLNSSNWANITDIRYQYIFELWRVPQSSAVNGWVIESQFRHILDCANGTGTLT